MAITPEPDPESELKSIAQYRRITDLLWLALMVIIVLVGAIAWLVTGKTEYLFGGLFFAAFPFMGLIYNHFFLFNPWRSLADTKRYLEDVVIKRRKNARTVGYVNGTILMLSSPLVMGALIATGSAEFGTLGAVVGCAAGVLFFAAGLGMLVWAKRN